MASTDEMDTTMNNETAPPEITEAQAMEMATNLAAEPMAEAAEPTVLPRLIITKMVRFMLLLSSLQCTSSRFLTCICKHTSTLISETNNKTQELINFKSYAGTKTIGPFHKRFSSVVGPNGSGKSNVIDAMLFVFGKRAKKLRLNKVRFCMCSLLIGEEL